jgi:hypothetical protein
MSAPATLEQECPALGCHRDRVGGRIPLCARHWGLLLPDQRENWSNGAADLDGLIIALGLREQRSGVRF